MSTLTPRLEAMSPEERAVLIERLRPAWDALVLIIRRHWDALTAAAEAIAPLLRRIRRAEARRVHTAYRARRRGRW